MFDISLETSVSGFNVSLSEGDPSGSVQQIKLSGTFATKPTLVKLSGTFVEKPTKVKVGGTFI